MTQDCKNDEDVKEFVKSNKEEGMRVFVACGSRSGNDDIYVEEAYNLGRQIIKMDFKLDFGLSNRGIMGAVAKGVLDGWKEKKEKTENPILGITTQEYYSLYPNSDEILCQTEVIFATTLEERKQKLLNADFVVFAPGGVGTLDELAYDCVAMQDGFLPMKPFVLYNINGFFYHLVEYLKSLADTGFSDQMPFIVVDNSDELEVVFRLLKLRYSKCETTKEAYVNARQVAYKLPYFMKRREYGKVHVEDLIDEMENININGSSEDRLHLASEIETAYLEKEIGFAGGKEIIFYSYEWCPSLETVRKMRMHNAFEDFRIRINYTEEELEYFRIMKELKEEEERVGKLSA